MIQLSAAARTLLASLAVHASVLAAVAGGSAATRRPVLVEIDIDTTAPRLEPPPKEALAAPPETPRPNVVVRAAQNATRANAPTRQRPAEVLRVTPEGRTEGDSAPAILTAGEGAPARFVMAFGTGTTVTGTLAKTDKAGGTNESDTYAESGVSSRARLLEGTPPDYPQAARAAAVEADLPLEIVVDPTGKVVDARLLRHAGYGLDEAALRAVRGYRFIPAQRDGRGVSVRMRWVVDFRLD